jgi:hypothetical protein
MIKKVNHTRKSKLLWIRSGVGIFSEGGGGSKSAAGSKIVQISVE